MFKLGTNMEKANEIIRNSGLNIIPELDLDLATQKAIKSIKLQNQTKKFNILN